MLKMFPAVFLVCAFPVASGAATMRFQDRVSPTTSYAGTRDITVWDAAKWPWEPGVNHDRWWWTAVDGSPIDLGMLLRFDLSTIPRSAVITSASLRLTVTEGTGSSIPVREAFKPWNEQQATWNQAADGIPWTLPGAQDASDRCDCTLATLTGRTLGPRLFPLTASGLAVLQGWVADPTSNNGFVIQSYDDADGMAWESAESGVPTERPALIVDYTDGGMPFSRTFQNGVSPTPAYAGVDDVVIANGPDPKTVNWDGELTLRSDSSQASVLISFDVSQIPPWATVQSASLEFHIAAASTGTFSVYEVLQPWTETGASWNSFDGTSPWSTPGIGSPGDRGDVSLGVIAPDTAGVRRSFKLNASGGALVQDWVTGAKANRGLVLQNYSATRYATLAARERPAAERPALVVDYVEGELVLTSASQQTMAGAISGPLTVRRQRLDGTPIGAGAPALSVTVASSSSNAAFGTTQAFPYDAPTLSVTIPAGESSSAPFYYWDFAVGTSTLTASAGAAWNPGQLQTPIVPFEFADDFETGTLNQQEVPAGRWPEVAFDPATATLTVTSDASHRGGGGFRFDDHGATGSDGNEGYIGVRAPPGDYHVRFWARLTPSSDVGSVVFAQVETATSTGSRGILDFWLINPGGRLEFAGHDVRDRYFSDAVEVQPAMGQWHLVELAILGLGTANGTRQVVIDGTTVGARTGLDWTWADLKRVNFLFGAPWEQPLQYTGMFDFDDLRISQASHASRLGISPLQVSAPVDACVEATVQLLDSMGGAPAPAPYAVDVALAASGVPGAFFRDSGCADATTTVTLPAGATSTSVFFEPTAPGTAQLSVSQVDFLSLAGDQGSLMITGDLPGPTSPKRLEVGCAAAGEQGGPFGMAALFGLLAWASRPARAAAA